jgi:hypothetical protein
MKISLVLGLCCISRLVFAEHVTPIEKVISLVEGMISDLETESTAEATAYDTFACFCRDTTKTKSDAIASGKDSIDSGSSAIEEKTALKAEKSALLIETKKAKEALTLEKQETQATLDKEKTAYETKSADLDKALSSLAGAITSLNTAKQAPSGALLTFKQVVKSNPSVAEAIRLVEAGPKWSAFLQKASVDPLDPEYQYHSEGIIEILEKLQGDFQEEKQTTDLEWSKTRTTLTDTITELEQQIVAKEGEISGLENDIDVLAGELAELKTTLLNDQASMKDDELYMKDLTTLCEQRANQWDQRSQMRKNELTALKQAVGILKGKVTDNEVVNVRAFAQINQHQQSSFSEPARTRRRDAYGFLQISMGLDQRRASAISFLKDEAKRLNSGMLSALSSGAGSDPFAKVKGLIQKLVERLIAEATAEATKKGFCDNELAKAYNDRDARLESVKKLSADIGELDAKLDALDFEASELGKNINSLKEQMNTSSTLRKDDKKTNLEAVAKAREGLAAVTEALAILKDFYKQAAKAAAFEQTGFSPVEEDTSGPGFDGAYKGKQSESKGVIGLLEVIKSDFERTIKTTVKTEKESAEEYVKFDRTSKGDVSSKTTKKELDEQDWETAKARRDDKKEEMESNMHLLDDALKTIEGLKPTCIDNVMKFDDRAKKRQDELESLHKALCILDSEKVETECGKYHAA